MWGRVFFGSIVFASCGINPADDPLSLEGPTTPDREKSGALAAGTTVTLASDTVSYASYRVPPIKRPSGIYQLRLPAGNNRKILHTIAFEGANYRLQEEYLDAPDSVVITEGTWAPSQGFIWLYKDQVVRGRYSWRHDTLQYVSSGLDSRRPLQKLVPAATTAAWQKRGADGALFFGVGNEPFWSIEVTRHDSAILSMPDWDSSLKVKLSQTTLTRDSTVYLAEEDSLQIVVLPRFCSDGMSDFAYRHKVIVHYKNKRYEGCGTAF